AAALAPGRARRRAVLRLDARPAGRPRPRARFGADRVAARLHPGQRPLGGGRRRALGAPPHAALPDAEGRGADRPRRLLGRRPARAVARPARAPAALATNRTRARMNRVAVVGAADIIGPAIVATLAECEAVDEILCLDVNADGARAVAESHGGGRAAGGGLDITDRTAAQRAVDGATVLLNTAAYRINLAAMQVALD